MNVAHKPVWVEGVLLGQQHFQAYDDYVHQQLCALWQRDVDFYGWISFSLDQTRLQQGQVVLQEFKLILPNGVCITEQQCTESPLYYDLNYHQQAELTLGLTIPHRNWLQDIAQYESAEAFAPLQAHYATLADSFDPKRQREVLCQRYPAMLTVSPQTQAALHFPMIKLIKTESSQYQIDPLFLSNSANIHLQKELLQAIIMPLAKAFGQLSNSPTAIVQTVHYALLQLHQLGNKPWVHPRRCYEVLVKAWSDVMCGDDGVWSIPPDYQHTDSATVLLELAQQIADKLKTLDAQAQTHMSLTLKQPGVWVSELLGLNQHPYKPLYIAIHCQQLKKMSLESITQHIQVCAPTHIDALKLSAAKGLALKPLAHPQSGGLSFSIEPMGELWQAIIECDRIAIILQAPLTECECYLGVL